MALAIELAASRYPTLGLDGLEAGLHERLRFLTVGGHAADRHRSLRDTIGWSYDLLDSRRPGAAARRRRLRVLVRRRRRPRGRHSCARPRGGRRRAVPPRRPQPAPRRPRRADPLPTAGDDPAVRRGAARRVGRACRRSGPARRMVPRRPHRSRRRTARRGVVHQVRLGRRRCPGRAAPVHRRPRPPRTGRRTRGPASRTAMAAWTTDRGQVPLRAGRRTQPVTDRPGGAPPDGGRRGGFRLLRHRHAAPAPRILRPGPVTRGPGRCRL